MLGMQRFFDALLAIPATLDPQRRRVVAPADHPLMLEFLASTFHTGSWVPVRGRKGAAIGPPSVKGVRAVSSIQEERSSDDLDSEEEGARGYYDCSSSEGGRGPRSHSGGSGSVRSEISYDMVVVGGGGGDEADV